MKLEMIGKANAPEVLLLSRSEALAPLGKDYGLLLPSFDEEATPEARLAALERELLFAHGGRLRGVYALDGDTALALSLLLHGAVRVEVTVVEGEIASVPGNAAAAGRIVYWHRKKDRAAKKTQKALRELASPLSTVTMKKLPKNAALADLRPDIAVKQLEKAFGGGVTVTRAAMVPGSVETVWQELSLSPAGGETALLTQVDPILCADGEHVQILSGSSKKLRFWNHMIRLERADDELTYVTDQIELDAGKLNALAAPLVGLYLKSEQQRRSRLLKKGRHAL